MKERENIRGLLAKLNRQRRLPFPAPRERLNAPKSHGVYAIFNARGRAVHVGRSVRGRAGLFQRLGNHLNGISSFARRYLGGRGTMLRHGFTFQYLKVPNKRARVLLEYAATVWHCPAHLGVGAK